MRRFLHVRAVLRLATAVCALAGVTLEFLPGQVAAQTGAQTQQQQQQAVIRFVANPDSAPLFKVKDLNGKELSIEAFKGKVVLLNFWATWCGPCRAEIPSLIQLQNAYKDRMQIIGMDVDDEDEGDVRAVVEKEGINYPVAITPMQVRMAYGGIVALPTLFVINAEGRMVQKHVGLFNPALYEVEVRALLDLPVPVKVETFEDKGEVFLQHADRATTLPGVDMTKLTAEQKLVALHKLNAQMCDCGCKLTLAQCRIWDRGCSVSKDKAEAIVKEIAGASTPDKDKQPEQAPVAAPTTTTKPGK